MRVGIIAILQESNTFINGVTTLAHFEQDLLAEGAAVADRLRGSHHETAGFFAELDASGIEAVPIFAARAYPYATVADDAFQHLMARLTACLNQAGPLDGVLVAPHGATVSAKVPDFDGHWLNLVREHVGPKIPIIGTLDLHGNVSPQMGQACDALIGYRTNPHLDQYQRGLDAARMMVRTLRGEIRPTMACQFPPLGINIERQACAEMPCKAMYQLADDMLKQPGVLSNTLMLGFPYADVAEMGASLMVVTDNNPELARKLSRELAQAWWNRRHDFIGQLIPTEAALDQAEKLLGPICLLDMGDNAGGGSPADGTEIIHALYRRKLGPAFASLYDPEAVQQALAAGVGSTVKLTVGGKTDDQHGAPLTATFRVLGDFDGKFEETQPRHGGFTKFDQGRTALVESEGLTLMLTSRRMVPFSIRQLTAFGVDPAKFRYLVAKGVHAPVAAYRPVSQHLIRVDTSGVTCADMTKLAFHHRRRPMFPFEMDTQWTPE